MINDKILILGATGQLGSQLRELLDSQAIDYLAPSSKQLDITNADLVTQYFQKYQPTIIFDCAAYTNVDGAEDEPGKTLDHKINAAGTQFVAQAAEMIKATLFYISTDYVFDGNKTTAYLPEDQPHPQCEYGRTKAEGETSVLNIMSKYYIIRTSWVFGQYGHNFVYTMLQLAENHSQIKVVNDQIGRPTWAKTLAQFMIYTWRQKINYGIYQLSNDNYCSWYQFAQEILTDKRVELIPISSADYPQKAQRPQRSIMNLDKVKATGFLIPTWQSALREFKEEITN